MLERPSLQTLADRIRNDILARFNADDILRRSDAEIYARVEALAMHAMYGYVDWQAAQMFADTCDESMLDRHATFWKVPRKVAAPATGSVTFATSIGAVIPEGTVVRALDGVEYATTAAATAVSASTAVNVEASAAGAAGNRAGGQSVLLVQPIDGVQTTAVAGVLSGGADIETVSAWRARILAAMRKPPAAGTANDYVMWALEVPGVTRAWAYPLEMGLGTVVVRFVRDDDASLIPDSGEVATVQAYIDALCPITATITVAAPVAEAVDFTIAATPNTAEVKAAITAELEDLLLREAEPGGTLLLSHVREAISLAPGETNSILTVPAADVTKATGKIATLGTITWA